MAFVKKQGKTKFMYFPVTTSTAIKKGSLVAWASGLLVAATNTVDSFSIAGVLHHAITSSDADYATARNVEVEVPTELNVVWEADVTDGTPNATTDVGLYKDLATADDGSGVDVSASALDIFLVTQYVSATKIRGVLNIGAAGKVKS